jgi:uncharacterized protein (DUF1499 family)
MMGQTMTGFLDFRQLQRPASPNTALSAPPGFADAARPDLHPPVFKVAPGDLYMRLLNVIAARRDWQLGEQDAALMRVSFVATSPIMRFKDDVDVLILPVGDHPGQSTFAAYSRSRVGNSDLGANRQRLAALSAALEAP